MSYNHVNLSDDLADLEKQLTEGGASVHDLEKAKKKLQQELEELNLMMEVGVVTLFPR